MANGNSSMFDGAGLPRAAIVLAALVVAPELVFFFGDFFLNPDRGWAGSLRAAAAGIFAFLPGLIEAEAQNGLPELGSILRLFTYPFIHLNAISALFSAVFILVPFRMIGYSARPERTLAAFFATSAIGALAYYYLAADNFPLTGAAPGYLGLFGVAVGAVVMTGAASDTRRMGMSAQTALLLPALLLGFEIVSSLIVTGSKLWFAELSGFLFGFLVAPLVYNVPYSTLIARLLQLFR